MRGSGSLPSLIERREGRIALALGILGALRLLWLGACFPLFANTDEHAHFDVVVKHSHGYLPRLETSGYDRESANLILLYRSPEYFHPGKPPPPLWQRSAESREPVLAEGEALWTAKTNHEAFQPPLYYWLASGMYRLTRGLGLDGGQLPYALRFLNAFFFGLTFFAAWRLCHESGPGSSGFRLSVLLLLAVFPQDALFTIGNDAVSPLLFLLALYGVLRLRRGDPGVLAHVAAGSAVAAALLGKFTNVAILPIALLLLGLGLRERRIAGSPTPASGPLGFALALTVPVGLWLAWNTWVVSDATGHAGVAGWTLKRPGEMLGHPLFGGEGAIHFIRETTASFWRGEIVWRGRRLASPASDALYVWTTLLFVAAAVLGGLLPGRRVPGSRRLIEAAAALSILLGLLLLAGVSVAYDFGAWPYPSRESPFLSSGRLLSGALVPFLILYVSGLELLVRRLWPSANLLVFSAPLALFILVTELALARPAAASPYNWLHL